MRISIIALHGAAALVEWHDAEGLHRATIPFDAIRTSSAGEYDADGRDLQQGIPFGEPFEHLEIGRVGAAAVARELHARGIWTAQDVQKNVAGVRAALLAAYSKDLETVLNAARARR